MEFWTFTVHVYDIHLFTCKLLAFFVRRSYHSLCIFFSKCISNDSHCIIVFISIFCKQEIISHDTVISRVLYVPTFKPFCILVIYLFCSPVHVCKTESFYPVSVLSSFSPLSLSLAFSSLLLFSALASRDPSPLIPRFQDKSIIVFI